MDEAWKQIAMYKSVFPVRDGGLPIMGQSSTVIINVGKACLDAIFRGSPLTADEMSKLGASVSRRYSI